MIKKDGNQSSMSAGLMDNEPTLDRWQSREQEELRVTLPTTTQAVVNSV